MWKYLTKRKKKKGKTYNTVRHSWDIMKWNNIRSLGAYEGMEKNGLEGLFREIKVTDFLNLEKWWDIQAQETHRTPNRHDPKLSSLGHVTVQFSVVKQHFSDMPERDARSPLEGLQPERQLSFSSEAIQTRASPSQKTKQQKPVNPQFHNQQNPYYWRRNKNLPKQTEMERTCHDSFTITDET